MLDVRTHTHTLLGGKRADEARLSNQEADWARHEGEAGSVTQPELVLPGLGGGLQDGWLK